MKLSGLPENELYLGLGEKRTCKALRLCKVMSYMEMCNSICVVYKHGRYIYKNIKVLAPEIVFQS